jgi:tetratricopeptide (TPR) repeat protein
MTGELKEQNNDTIFQDSINALRNGDKPRAKELLTLLLKTNQNNATYWIWLSASVEAPKERIYCLQTALKLDPENSTAKRGLILLGALPPDETIQPFPMNRPRAWEEKLLLAHEKPKERGLRAVLKSPLVRLGSLTVIGIGMCALIFFGLILPRIGTIQLAPTSTAGPSPTFTATPTIFGATAIPTQVFVGPTPLSAFLDATYTPTALYVNTPRSVSSIDQFRIAMDAYEKGEWDVFIDNMLLLEPLEPESPDIPYYIGEAYRFKGDTGSARSYYNKAIDLDPDFAPAYLGLARMELESNPTSRRVEGYFEDAIERDPNFGEVYLERARWLINREDFEDAFADLELAEQILPGSPEVYIAYANAYRGEGDSDMALEYAQKAYAADILNLPTYKLLGDLYLEREDYVNAAEALRLYTTYQNDATGFGKLGQAYYYLGEYENAVAAINSGEEINRNGMQKYVVYRGLSHVELGNFNDAEGDMNTAVEEESQSFEARLGYTRALYGVEKFGSAFLQAESMRALAETDEEKALELFWRGRIQEQRNDIRDAIKSWNDLLKLDEDVMTPEMRAEAEERLKVLVPPTDTPEPSNTPRGGASTSTPTASPSGTPATPTKKPVTSPTPSRTPSVTPTP